MNESPIATTSTSSTTTASVSSRPSGSVTFTLTPETFVSGENGTRLITNFFLHACLSVSPLPAPARGSHEKVHSPVRRFGEPLGRQRHVHRVRVRQDVVFLRGAPGILPVATA